MVSFRFFMDAFRLVVLHPKLFGPKLVIAVLYGLLMLATVGLALQTLDLNATIPIGLQAATGLLVYSLFLLAAALVMLVLDVWVASWYPVLVSDYRRQKPLSFVRAARSSWPRFSVVLPLLLGVEIVVSVLLALISVVVVLALPVWFMYVAGIVVLVLVFGFYVALYPLLSVSVLESKSYAPTLARSFSLSKQNWKAFSAASVLPFVISLFNLVVAFLAEQPHFLVLFWVLRIVMALVVTYNTVLNPSAYFAVLNSNPNQKPIA